MPCVDYETTIGSTSEVLTVPLTINDLPFDLSTVTTVEALCVFLGDDGVEESIPMVIELPAVDGIVSRDWSLGFPSQGPGDYRVRYRATHNDGDVTYFPNKNSEGYLWRLRSPSTL
jgi:hypothetical protein